MGDSAKDQNSVWVLAGPTASGKSGAALVLAEAQPDGRPVEIVNADSAQVYCELRVLTARPGLADLGRAAHHLYGHVPACARFSVAAWLDQAQAAIAAIQDRGAQPLVVGGTGLYLSALIGGLSAIPPVPAPVRAAVAAALAARGTAALHAELAAIDPILHARLSPQDRSRIQRGHEVYRATGTPLSVWQRDKQRPPYAVRSVVLNPPPAETADRIATRARRMIADGALDEVAALLALGLDADLPAMKALGVAELAAVLRQECDLETATQRLIQATRRYAKRQRTWFRHQMTEDRLGPNLHSCHVLDWSQSARNEPFIRNILQGFR